MLSAGGEGECRALLHLVFQGFRLLEDHSWTIPSHSGVRREGIENSDPELTGHCYDGPLASSQDFGTVGSPCGDSVPSVFSAW